MNKRVREVTEILETGKATKLCRDCKHIRYETSMKVFYYLSFGFDKSHMRFAKCARNQEKILGEHRDLISGDMVKVVVSGASNYCSTERTMPEFSNSNPPKHCGSEGFYFEAREEA